MSRGPIPHVRRERPTHAGPPTSHGRSGHRDPRDRVVEPEGLDLGRACRRTGRGEELRSGADQRTARPRLPHRGGPPVPPGAGAVHPRRPRQQAGRAVHRSPVRGRAEQAARFHRPRRRAGRGRHRLHRPCRRRVARPDVRGPHPRPPPAVHQRGRKDAARQRPGRRDVPPPRPRPPRPGRRGPAIPRRAARHSRPAARLQPRRHVAGRLHRGHAAAGPRRESDRRRSARPWTRQKPIVSTPSAKSSRRRLPRSVRNTAWMRAEAPRPPQACSALPSDQALWSNGTRPRRGCRVAHARSRTGGASRELPRRPRHRARRRRRDPRGREAWAGRLARAHRPGGHREVRAGPVRH